jgi:hypothetical protein
MRLSEALAVTDNVEIAPKRGIRLSEAMSVEKSEVESKGQAQFPWLFSVMQPGAAIAAYAAARPPKAQAVAQGIFPVGGEDWKLSAKEHPIANAVGQLAGLMVAGGVTRGIASTVAMAPKLAALPTVARIAAARMAQTGATFGLKELSDNMAELLSGDQKPFGKVVGDTLGAASFGAGLGAVGTIPAPLLRIPAESAYGFATAKMQGATNEEAGINAALFGIFGLFNRQNMSDAYKKVAMGGAKRALVDRMIAKGVDKEKAAVIADRYFNWAIQRHGGWKETKIEDFDTFSKAMRKGWKIIVEPNMPQGTPGVPEKAGAEATPKALQPLAEEAKKYKTAIESAGGEWVGIQEGDPTQENIVMFNDPKTKTTLALPVSQVTPEAVKAKLSQVKEGEFIEPPIAQGETKVRGLASGVEEKAIENKLTKSFGTLPEYEVVNMKEQATKAQELLTQDAERAKRIAMGQEVAPDGILPESVFVAVENKAVKEGDVALLKDLASSSGLTEEATTMGQRIRTLAERDPESPVTAINEVVKAREQSAKKRLKAQHTKKLHKETIGKIKEEINKALPGKTAWEDFIRSIQC